MAQTATKVSSDGHQSSDWSAIHEQLRAHENSRGIRCFPVGIDKTPVAQWLPGGSWKAILAGTADARTARFQSIHESGQPFLIAAVPGESHAVIDIDALQEFERTTNTRAAEIDGPRVQTPAGGYQIWAENPSSLPYVNFGWGELRTGKQHYCILPGSGHEAVYEKGGRSIRARYRWAEGSTALHLWEGALPPVPDVIRKLVDQHATSSGERAQTDGNECIEILRGLPAGQRNEQLFKYACSLRARSTPVAEAIVLVERAASACVPPYPSDAGEELPEKIVERVYERYDGPKDTGPDAGGKLAAEIREKPDSVWERVDQIAALDAAGLGAFKDALRDEKGQYPFAMGQLDKAIAEQKRRLSVLDPFCAADVAEQLLRRRYKKDDGLTLRHYHAAFWEWTGTCYRELPDEEIDTAITDYLQSKKATRDRAGTKFDNDVKRNLAALVHVPDVATMPCLIHDGKFSPAQNMLAFENGIVDLNELVANGTAQLLPHTPKLFTLFAFDHEYDPHADCPRWKEFLAQVLPDVEVTGMLQEVFGLCLLADMSLQVFFVFVGEGANGKTVAATVLRGMIGNENVSALPLELLDDKHNVVALRGKLLNISPEIGDIDKTCEGMLKAIVGGDPITFDQKYKPVITECPTARLLIITNELPRFRDRSQGLWRRIIVVPFPVVIPEDERDPNLADELCNELPGVFNWAVEGLRRLRGRGRFDIPDACRQAAEEHRRDCNPARAFLEDKYEARADHQIGAQQLYTRYAEHCKQNGYSPLGEANFGKELKRVFPGMEKRRCRGADGKREAYYVGLDGPGATPITSNAHVQRVLAETQPRPDPTASAQPLEGKGPVIDSVNGEQR